MSPSSSTSDSETRYRSWWLLALACCLLPTLAAAAVTAWGALTGRAQLRVSELRAHQMAKLADPRIGMDMVFVGDSSLGNAIDAATWQRLSGLPTANLALTGSFGYAGSFNMLRRAVRTHGTRYAVIFQAADMMTRDVSYAGYAQTLDLHDWYQVSPIDLVGSFLNWTLLKASLRGLIFGADRPFALAGDYIAQERQLAPGEVVAEDLQAARINPRQEYFLKEIAEFCRAEGLRCVYAHGTVFEGSCAAAAYFAEVDRHIAAAGLTLVPGTPLCMPAADVGDGTDHVRPERKQAYTRRYFERIAPVLFGRAR